MRVTADTMRAMVIHEHGGVEVLTLEPRWPRPAADPGEIVVQVQACALNFLDIFTREGMPGEPTALPIITGGDIAGVVHQVGEGVRWPSVGDRVVLNPSWGCGVCEYCREGQKPRCLRGRMLGERDPGGLAEFVRCPAPQAIAVPPHYSLEAAACLPITFGTAWRMVVTHARIRPDDVVLVLGAGGGVAIAAIQIAKLMGARVIATASSDAKLARAKEFGADELINYAVDAEWDVTVRRLTAKRGADVVIETVGASTWERSIRALGKGGRLVTCGATSGPIGATDIRYLFRREEALLGSNGWTHNELLRVTSLAFQGKLRPVIDRVLPLEKTAEGEIALERREVFGKVVIRPEQRMLPDNLGYLFERAVKLGPSCPAILQDETVLTFEALDARSNRIANALAGLGVGPSDRVAIMFSNDFRFLESLFGSMRLGAVPVPLNTRMADDALEYVIVDAEASVMIANAGVAARAHRLAGRIPQVKHVIVQGPKIAGTLDYDALLEAAAPTLPRRATAFEDIAMQPYTSGSTGRPKGVLLTHGGQIWNADVLRKSTMVDEGDRALVAVPLCHKNAMAGAVKPILLAGGSLVVLPGFDPLRVIEAIERYRVTYMTGVPAMYKMILAEKEALATHDISSVRFAKCGSAEVPEELVAEFQRVFDAPLVEGYGLTEGGPVPMTNIRGALIKRGSCGRVVAGCDVKLIGADGHEVAANEVGELVTRNPGLARGYWKQPAATAERFRDGWLHTGDMMRRDEDGYYYFVGRQDDMINVAGENVYPKEVEDILLRHANVRDACVVPVPHDTKGEVPVAFVQERTRGGTTEEELKQFCLQHGAPYAHPRRVYFLDALPLAGTGKLDRAALKQLARQRMALPKVGGPV